MNIPGFNAESSLGPTIGIYAGKIGFGGSGRGEVSMQQFGGSFFDGLFGTPLRCCKADDGTRPLFCRTRIVFPTERCRCGHDFDGFPIFLCSSPLAHTASLNKLK